MSTDDKVRRYKERMISIEQKYEKDLQIEKQKNKEFGELAKRELHELQKRRT